MIKSLFKPETTKKMVTVFSLIITLLVATAGALGADAGIRASNANRDSQTIAHQVTQQLQRQGMQEMYEFNTVVVILAETMHSIAQNGMAAILESSADTMGAKVAMQKAAIADAKIKELKLLSILYSDPRYAPSQANELPNVSLFINDLNQNMEDSVKTQNDASDRYARFDSKSSTYTSIITILSITLFLLGLAQVVSNRLRITLGLLSLTICGIAVLWLGITILI